jgi:outer membrane protein assembly factor BamE (lipoprotein component of BamABCDE complex)
MFKSRTLINTFLKVLVTSLIPMVVTMNAGAQTTDRTAQLEKEIEAIKQRLNKLESAQGISTADPKPVAAATGTGYKSLASWRQLKNYMSPSDVRALLGEPVRINGGSLARWYYPNGGELVFVGDRLSQWNEP